jgi:hypothetical protein
MSQDSSNEVSKNQKPEAESSANGRRLEVLKVVLDFVSKCLYPAIALLLIALLYPAIGAIDLKSLVARLQSAKAGGYEFAFSEQLKAEGDQTAELNGTIEQLKFKVSELSQDVAVLRKAAPAATPPPGQIARREAKEAQFSNNSNYSVLVFYKPYQKEMAIILTKKLLSLGFKSSATPTDLREAVKQFDEDTAWVVYSEKGQEKLQDLKAVLPAVTGRIKFVYREDPYNLRSGDIQILLF